MAPAPRVLSFPLAVALTHKAVRKLRATHFGAFIRIAIASLTEDFNPFDATSVALQDHALCTPGQWVQIREGVIAALRVALPDIQAMYREKLEKKKQLSINGSKNIARFNEEKALRRREVLRTQDATLSDQVTAPVILHPIKAPRHHNSSIDMQARRQAKDTKSSGFVLTDKG